MNRQRAYQKRKKDKGICVSCTKPLSTAYFCEYHAAQQREYARKRYRKKKLGGG
jgi:hypothetical protein